MGKSVINLKGYFYNFIIFLFYILFIIKYLIKILISEVVVFFMKQHRTRYPDFFFMA